MDKPEKSELDIETKIHSLLVNGLDEACRRELLLLITRDARVRKLLEEMLVFQADARRAFGYNGIDQAASASLSKVKELDRIRVLVNHTHQAGSGRKRWLHRVWSGSFLWKVAALIVVTLSVYLAVNYHSDYQSIKDSLARLEKPDTVPELTEDEVNGFRVIWNEIADSGKGVRPWAVLNNSNGKFGYIQVADEDQDRRQMVLLRCILLTSDGKSYRQINLLLPANEDIRLTVPGAVMAGDTSIDCKVTTGDNWAMVNLVADDGKPEATVSGSVNIGQKPVGIGNFNINGEDLHVVLQAVQLSSVAS